MKAALFYAVLTHDGKQARMEIVDRTNVAQAAWEQLGGILKTQKGGGLHGEIHVSIMIEAKDCGVQDNDRGYYWSTVVPAITTEMKVQGNREWSNDDTHQCLKELFVQPNAKGRRTTTGLGEQGFKQYIETCIQWAAESLYITIPQRRRPGGFPEVEI